MIVANEMGTSDFFCNGDTSFLVNSEFIELEYEFIFFVNGVYKLIFVSHNSKTKKVTLIDSRIIISIV